MLRDKDLWLADLQHPNSDRQITSNSLGAGYAGSVRGPDGWEIYYTNIESSEPSPQGPSGTIGVYRYDVSRGTSERVLEFLAKSKQIEFSCCNVAVSPNARNLAYADGNGINVADLVTGQVALLATNVMYMAPTGKGGVGNFFPQWSLDGRHLSMLRIYYEGGEYVVFDFTTWQETRTNAYSYAYFSWTTQGDLVCASAGGLPPAIYDVSALRQVPLPFPKGNITATGCAVSRSGAFAISYGVVRDSGFDSYLAFFDERLEEVATLNSGGASTFVNPQALAWLPDSTAVVAMVAPSGQFVVVNAQGVTKPLSLRATRIFDILSP